MSNYIEHRPWGSFEHLLEELYCKVKRIIVRPGHKLSYQFHHKRNEVWVIVQGTATVTLDEEVKTFGWNSVVDIPIGTKHRVENKDDEDLIFIETQTGTYFGEDDIFRLEDDYGRLKHQIPYGDWKRKNDTK